MNITSLETSTETKSLDLLDLKEPIQFEWLARAGRLMGMALMVVNANMEILFSDQFMTEILELDSDIDFTQHNLLDLVEKLARRGDFGPGNPQIFIDLIKSEFSKPAQSEDQNPRRLNFLTPAGKRIQLRVDLEVDGVFMLACRDITQSYVEKHALKVAMDKSNSGYLIFDMEAHQFKSQNTMRSNPFIQNLSQRLTNRNHRDSIHEGDYKKLKETWSRAHKKREDWTGAFRTKDSKGETIWVRAQGTPQISENGTVTSYIVYCTEVTAQLRIQDDLRKAINQSEKALKAKNAFLGRLSHEIRTPMNAVVLPKKSFALLMRALSTPSSPKRKSNSTHMRLRQHLQFNQSARFGNKKLSKTKSNCNAVLIRVFLHQ